MPTKAAPAKSLPKKIEDLTALTLPFGLSFRQLVGTGATPEQAATAIEAATGRRIPAGVLQSEMQAAKHEADPLGEMADTLRRIKSEI